MVGVNLMKENEYMVPNRTDIKYRYEQLRYTSNNGLLSTADVLEEVFTNSTFPPEKFTTKLNKSMKEQGYSRADFWAFATMLAVQHGVEKNNKGCTASESGVGKCGHIRYDMDGCEIKMPRNFTFKFGRKDCDPEDGDNNMGRAFLTNRSEIHPNNQGDGKTTVDFFYDNFGLEAREAIVLMGGKHGC